MPVLQKQNAQRILDTLVQRGWLDATALRKADKDSKKQSVSTLDYIKGEKLVDEEKITKVTADLSGIHYVNLSAFEGFDPKTLEIIPLNVARSYSAIAVGLHDKKLVVATAEADNIQYVDFLNNYLSKYDLEIVMASPGGVKRGLDAYPVKIDVDAPDAAPVNRPTPTDGPFRQQKATELDATSPAEQALTAILQHAVRLKASDIHIESLETAVRVRIRVDGVLATVSDEMPKALAPSLIARIKICAELKVDEKRLPQDGEFVINVAGKTIDLRVAIAPTIWGEQVIMRILDRSGLKTGLQNLGYTGHTLQIIREAMKSSSGMILTSGPTGSGKTTSLYTLLREISTETIKVITLEDPVEYKMQGINQIPINPAIGLTFANGLRSVLRQDPDVIMVGEIRDKETASLAIQAALTGHLVFSTLHTNSAAGILPRLLDMGIEPFLISSTVRAVIGQRLIRRLLTTESEECVSDTNETASIKTSLGELLPKSSDSRHRLQEIQQHLGYTDLPKADESAYTIRRAVENSNNPTGAFKGRLGIYEVFSISDQIQELILARAPASKIQDQAQAEGMVTMRQDGYLKVLAGQTTPNEVNRVITEGNI